LDNEAITIFDDNTGVQIHQALYFKIVCWGYSSTTFHWRAFTDDDDENRSDEKLQSFTVNTSEGVAIERHVMSSVKTLMGRMDSTGVKPASFQEMLKTLTSLGSDGLTDHALEVVKQMAMGRKFDARQATQLINALGEISPFDKVEASCALYPDSLLHPSTFPSLLIDCFEDRLDRENICHRLGIILQMDGTIEVKGAAQR